MSAVPSPVRPRSIIKHGRKFVDERSVVQRLDTQLLPGETFYVWGSEVGLFFESRRRLPSGAFSVWPVVDGPAARRMTLRVMADLRRAKPEAAVVARWTQVSIKGRHPVLDWLAANYRPLAVQDEQSPFVVYVRRGGAFERRLALAPGT